MKLLDEARDLLARSEKTRAVEEVHLRALRLLVRELKKRKYAVGDDHGPPERGDQDRAPRRRGTPEPDAPEGGERRSRELAAEQDFGRELVAQKKGERPALAR